MVFFGNLVRMVASLLSQSTYLLLQVMLAPIIKKSGKKISLLISSKFFYGLWQIMQYSPEIIWVRGNGTVNHPACFVIAMNLSHIFYFSVVWLKLYGLFVAHYLGASNIPRNFDQCWAWCEQWLLFGDKFHAVGIAAICWTIWKTKNSACFEGKSVRSPISIICYACSLMEYWVGLFLYDDKEQLIAGANTMLKIALQMVGKEVKA